jgi:hypothetical protein
MATFYQTVTTPSGAFTDFDLAPNADIQTTKMRQRVLAEYVVPLTDSRVWDAVGSLLPSTAASDDLALITGTWGTNPVRVTAGDVKTLTATRRLYFAVPIPANYEDGQTIQLRIRCGMETTVASSSCTIDAEAYVGTSGALSADLVTTAPTTMNSLTAADLDFAINPASVDPGQLLEVRLTIASVDAATGTAVTPAIYKVSLLCDTRG